MDQLDYSRVLTDRYCGQVDRNDCGGENFLNSGRGRRRYGIRNSARLQPKYGRPANIDASVVLLARSPRQLYAGVEAHFTTPDGGSWQAHAFVHGQFLITFLLEPERA